MSYGYASGFWILLEPKVSFIKKAELSLSSIIMIRFGGVAAAAAAAVVCVIVVIFILLQSTIWLTSILFDTTFYAHWSRFGWHQNIYMILSFFVLIKTMSIRMYLMNNTPKYIKTERKTDLIWPIWLNRTVWFTVQSFIYYLFNTRTRFTSIQLNQIFICPALSHFGLPNSYFIKLIYLFLCIHIKCLSAIFSLICIFYESISQIHAILRQIYSNCEPQFRFIPFHPCVMLTVWILYSFTHNFSRRLVFRYKLFSVGSPFHLLCH